MGPRYPAVACETGKSAGPLRRVPQGYGRSMTGVGTDGDGTGQLDAATVDLLGVLAYGELCAFERMSTDARLAPTISDRAALGELAALELAHFRRLSDHLTGSGVDPDEAMRPFVTIFDAFHDSTEPKDWLEGIVKVYVGDGLATDFYREVAGALTDDKTRSLVLDVLADTGHAAFAVDRVTAATTAEPAIAGRLALWGRRLVGEALIQAQQVAVDRDALTELLVGQGDLAGITGLLKRLTDRHIDRMAAMGLAS